MRHVAVLSIASVVLAACTVPPPRYSLTDEERARLHPEPRPAPSRRPIEQSPEPSPAPSVEVVKAEAPQGERCERTRAERVERAKDAIRTFGLRLKQLEPLRKWAVAHNCELKDTTGTVLYRANKERGGGVRVSVQHGRPDDLICDTNKLPDELTPEVMNELLLHDSLTGDEVMFETYPECDQKERPSLKFRYRDTDQQKSILSL